MILLFDIGGTKIRLAVSDGKKINKNKTVIIPTPAEYSLAMGAIATEVQKLASDDDLEKAIGGIGGPLNNSKSKIIFHSGKTNLLDWVGKSVKEDLELALECEVMLENDATLGGLGEAVFGIARKDNIVAYLTLGTGIGGARVVNGEIDENSHGFEPGKQVIDVDGSILPDHKAPVILEDVLAGQVIEKRMKKMPSEIKDEKFWREMARYLAIGLNGTIVHWSPDVVVLGGSVAKEISLKEVKHQLRQILITFDKIPDIKLAKLGEFSGIYGALAHYQVSRGE